MVQEIRRKKAIAVDWRARLPWITRVLALFVIVAGIIFVGISYYRSRNNKPFVMIPGAPELSKQVTSVVEGYERRVTEGDRLRILLRAARDITYADNHHELEDVHLEVYPPEGSKPDQITARRSIYDPEKGIISFKGDVNLETRDSLKAKTEVFIYNQTAETAETDQPITFVRENVSGHATGAFLDAKNKRLELRNSVEITVAPEVKAGAKPGPRARPVLIRAAHASFDHARLHLSF